MARRNVTGSASLMRLQSYQGSNGAGESASKHSNGCWQAIIPHHMGTSMGGLCVPMLWSMVSKERKEETKMEPPSFCNFILEMTSYHFCHILFIRRKPINSSHMQGKGITQEHEHQETRIINLETSNHA